MSGGFWWLFYGGEWGGGGEVAFAQDNWRTVLGRQHGEGNKTVALRVGVKLVRNNSFHQNWKSIQVANEFSILRCEVGKTGSREGGGRSDDNFLCTRGH